MKIIYNSFKRVVVFSLAAALSTGTALAFDAQAMDTGLNQALLADTELREHMADLRRADPELRKAEARAKANAAKANAVEQRKSPPNSGE